MKKTLLLVVVLMGTSSCHVFARGIATGFAISEKYVLTAYEVVGNARSVQLKFEDGDWMRADYLEGKQDEGWCVLKLQGIAQSFVIIEDKKESKSGDEVYVFSAEKGDASQERISFYDGDVVSVEKDSSCGAVISHSVKMGEGAIGAGLFSEEDNHAIGLIVGEQGRSGRGSRRAIALCGKIGGIRQYVAQQNKVTRKNNRKAVCVIQSDELGASENRRRASTYNASNDANTATYQKSKNSVATIEGEEGQGTGFLCEMDGKKYFVTNRHVARQRGQMTAYFLDGKTMEFGRDDIIEVADNRDLVRFEIKEESSRPFLKASNTTPNIGDKIEFYGNAGGGKVVTVTAGRILAVGQERIEIDSPIQGGNSGSPLVQVSDGCVIGVTTISTFNYISGDASKVGTRYDPNVKLTREFAVRFSGVTWNSVTYGSFLRSVNVYRDLCIFYHWMKKVCLADRQTGVYEYQLSDLKLVGATQLNGFMRKIAMSDEQEKRAWDRIVAMREKNRDDGKFVRYGKMEFEIAWKNYKDKATKAYKTRKEVLLKVLNLCKSTRVLSQDEKEDAIEAFDWQYRTYCEKYRMQLKGVFPRPTD